MGGRIIALIIKEFLALLKDKKSRVVLIVPPIMQLLVFGYAATFDLDQVPYAVHNQDTGQASRDLLERFRRSTAFRLVATLDSQRPVDEMIDTLAVRMLIQIGPDFSKNLQGGQTAQVQVILDGRNSNTAMVMLGYSRSIISTFSRDWQAARGGPSPPAELKVRSWFNPNLESRWFIVPGIVGLLTLVVTLVVTALSVAREREAGTFDQLLVTPLLPVEILIGKATPGLIIGLIEAGLISLAGVYWFGVPFVGSMWPLLAGLALFILSAVGVGLMISSLAATQQQGLLGAFIFMVPAIILSGYATPIANMPLIVQKLSLANPLRYFLVVVRGVFLEGSSLEVLWPQYWPMAIIAVVTLVAASWLFRNRMY